eukprot:4859973-Prymnesium_polylepis.1
MHTCTCTCTCGSPPTERAASWHHRPPTTHAASRAPPLPSTHHRHRPPDNRGAIRNGRTHAHGHTPRTGTQPA